MYPNLISVKLRIRTSSSQFILAEDHNDKCSTDSGAVACSDVSVVEKIDGKQQQHQLEQGAMKMMMAEGGGGEGEGESTTEPMDTEEKQTCKHVGYMQHFTKN